jgi:hypothetical protein
MAISDLSITLTDGKTSVVPGVNYSNSGGGPNPPANDYTVTVTNNGPDTVTQFNLNIVPGAGLTWGGTLLATRGFKAPRTAMLTRGYGAG